MACGQAGGATRAGGRHRRLLAASSTHTGRRRGENRRGPGDGPPGSPRSCLSSGKPSGSWAWLLSSARPLPDPSAGAASWLAVHTSLCLCEGRYLAVPPGVPPSLLMALKWHRDWPKGNIYRTRGQRDRWMDGGDGGGSGGQASGWVQGRMSTWMMDSGQTSRQTEVWTEGWMDGWINRRKGIWLL